MPTTLQRLAAVLPAGRVLVQPESLAAYESDGLTAFEVVWPAIRAQQDPEERELLLEGLFGPRGPNLYGRATEVPEGIDHSWVFKYEIDGE